MAKTTQPRRPRREFDYEFKAGAVRLVLDEGQSVGRVAREPDLTESAFRNWVRRAHADRTKGQTGLTSEEREELRRLRKEKRRLRVERDVLKNLRARARPSCPKNTNELKTGVPGRFDRHRPVASPRSGACRRRCRRFGFPVRAGKTLSSNGMPRSRAETWI